MKKFIGLCFWVLLMAASLAAHAEAVGPDVLVKNIAQEVLSAVSQDNAILAEDREAILRLVDAKVLPHFNFERMTWLAVGKNWRKASPEQKNTLVAEFRSLLVNTYTNAFTRYQNQTVKVLPADMSAGVNEVTAIGMATQVFTENPMTTPLIPNWNRVTSATPDIFEMLKTAVDADNK